MFPVALSLGGLLARVAALAVVPRVISLLNRTPKVNLRQEAPVETPVAEAPAVLEAVLKTRQVATPRRQNSHALLAETPSLQAWQSPSAARAPPLAGAETRSRAYLYRRSFPVNRVDPMGLEAGILRADGTYTQYAANQQGWADFVHAVQRAQPGEIADLYVFGHGGTTGIYPGDRHDTANSYIWHDATRDRLRLGYTENGVHHDIPLEKLGLHRLKIKEVHLKGCNTAKTDDKGLNLSRRVSDIVPSDTTIEGSTDTYWFQTELEQADLRTSPIQSPAGYPGNWGR